MTVLIVYSLQIKVIYLIRVKNKKMRKNEKMPSFDTFDLVLLKFFLKVKLP